MDGRCFPPWPCPRTRLPSSPPRTSSASPRRGPPTVRSSRRSAGQPFGLRMVGAAFPPTGWCGNRNSHHEDEVTGPPPTDRRLRRVRETCLPPGQGSAGSRRRPRRDTPAPSNGWREEFMWWFLEPNGTEPRPAPPTSLSEAGLCGLGGSGSGHADSATGKVLSADRDPRTRCGTSSSSAAAETERPEFSRGQWGVNSQPRPSGALPFAEYGSAPLGITP